MIDTSTDGHVHTPLCGHARGSMEEFVRAAIDRGLAGIVFLEHLECGIRYFETVWLDDHAFASYFEEGRRLQKKFEGKIRIGLGVEIGYNPDAVAEITELLARYPWDRRGLSCHFHLVGDRHCNLVSRKARNMEMADSVGVDRLVKAYYTSLIEAMAAIPADVVCHLDAVLRYHPAIASVDQRPFIDQALQAMAARGLALEVNTSGYAIRRRPFPDIDVLSRARELGIALWPGSDAHRPEDTGRFFTELAALDL